MEHQLNQIYRSKPAFVLGNGKSRAKLQLTSLKQYATVYACNAIYRDYSPDYLIAVDTKMVDEIVKSGFHNFNSVWTNPNRSVHKLENINLFNPHKGWSSGPTALWFATQHQHQEIYIFGFDFQGIGGKFNNVYADTFNYKKSSDSETYHGNWLNQTYLTIKENINIEFYRVIESNNYIPDKLSELPNLEHIKYSDFVKKYPECI
jgi:hypothetical protein